MKTGFEYGVHSASMGAIRRAAYGEYVPPTKSALLDELRALSARCRRLAYPTHPPIFIEIADEIDRLSVQVERKIG